MSSCSAVFFFFFFLNDPATPEIYPLPLHDALPICREICGRRLGVAPAALQLEPRTDRLTECGSRRERERREAGPKDRKSTRLNSSHLVISYAVFCLKKKTHNIS